MAAVNDVTGDAIKSKGTTDRFRDNFDKIFDAKKSKESGSKKKDIHELTILWGSSPEPDDKPETYKFNTKDELDSFMKGVRAGHGWDFWTIIDQ